LLADRKSWEFMDWFSQCSAS